MKRIRHYLFIVFLISVSAGYGLHAVFPEKTVDESLYLNEVAQGVIFSAKKGNHYTSREGITAFSTYDVTPSIRGYAGPVKTLISLSPDGRIHGIRILEHKETPNFVHRMETPEFLRQFLGKSINDPFEVDKDIDAISRATVSVEALSKTVRESSRKIASEAMGLEVVSREKAGRFNLKWAAYCLLFLLSLAGYFITRGSKRFLRLRDISLVLGIGLVGLWLSTPFSILHIFNLLLLRPSSDMLWYAIVISAVLSVGIAGRFYCGWLCPFGALSEFLGRVPLRKWEIPLETDDRWRGAKYFLFGLVIAAVFITGRPGFGNYETYVTLFSFHGNALAWGLVALSLLLNLRLQRFWCRYLCPVAALMGLLSRKAEGYPGRHDCPMGNRQMPLISECIRCNRCYGKGQP
ncbi:MAG: 4Fe-4S binding protein [Thermodesulfovibrionales bacterium]|nr:4Fe-4S binding protein [Thermodesulfovibrionales bacterium]